MEYRWSLGLFCGASLYVKWSTDELSEITGGPAKLARIEGEYYSACL
jgi:hypothetical protein